MQLGKSAELHKLDSVFISSEQVWDYKCDTFGLEHLHKSWPKVSDGGDTPASGKVRIKGANQKMSETRALTRLTVLK